MAVFDPQIPRIYLNFSVARAQVVTKCNTRQCLTSELAVKREGVINYPHFAALTITANPASGGMSRSDKKQSS